MYKKNERYIETRPSEMVMEREGGKGKSLYQRAASWIKMNWREDHKSEGI
jgi:hypothetical protein